MGVMVLNSFSTFLCNSNKRKPQPTRVSSPVACKPCAEQMEPADAVCLTEKPFYGSHTRNTPLCRLSSMKKKFKTTRLSHKSPPFLLCSILLLFFAFLISEFSSTSPIMQAHGCFTDTGRYPETATYDNCALCVIRPHAVKTGDSGAIISAIMSAGLEISAMKMIHLSRPEANELFEVYKGVLPYYAEIISEMISAPCIFMEVRAEGVVEALRKLSGPHDVELARHIMSDSLRARFGVSNAMNAVHCTDLASDGELEVRYVFEILDRVQAI